MRGGGVQEVPNGGAGGAPELNKRNKDNQGERKNSRKKLTLEAAPSDWHEDLAEYIEHRRNIKKPLTQKALNRFIASVGRCVDAGHSSSTAILTPIDRGWSSVKVEWLDNLAGKGGSDEFCF